MKRQRMQAVDDDPDIRRLVGAYFHRDGMEVITAEDGETALVQEATQQPDIVVLDLMLPGIGGLDVLRTIRPRGTRPVVLLTAREEVTDRVLGLELGADDYVTKPFHPRELVARVHSVLRRAQTAPTTTTARVGDLQIDGERRLVRRDGEPIQLTRTEFELAGGACPRRWTGLVAGGLARRCGRIEQRRPGNVRSTATSATCAARWSRPPAGRVT